jgi:hypothetical protein
MKPTTKRLAINKQTVRILSDAILLGIRGGAPTDTVSIDTRQVNSCYTDAHTDQYSCTGGCGITDGCPQTDQCVTTSA